MSVASVVSLPHPLGVAVEQIEDALDRMPVVAWDGLAATAVRGLVERLMRVEARVKAHQLAGARVLDDSGLAKSTGATSTGAMLAGSFGGDRRAGDQAVRMGKAMTAAPRTGDALANGQIGAAQAGIIGAAIADLPTDTTAEQKQACEDTLIGDADRFTLKDLQTRATRITDQFKPEPEVDKHENDTLAKQEKAAWKRSEFWMCNDKDGTCRRGFRLPEAQADMLAAAINKICAPRRDHLRDHPRNRGLGL